MVKYKYGFEHLNKSNQVGSEEESEDETNPNQTFLPSKVSSDTLHRKSHIFNLKQFSQIPVKRKKKSIPHARVHRKSRWLTTDLENTDVIQIDQSDDENGHMIQILQSKTPTSNVIQNNEMSHQLTTDLVDDTSLSIPRINLEPGSSYEEIYVETGKNYISQAHFHTNLIYNVI